MKFSVIGLILVLVILVPNILWAIFPPMDEPTEDIKGIRSKSIRILEAVEGLGRGTAFMVPLFLVPHFATAAGKYAAWTMAISVGFYYAGWVRYFSTGRKYALLFSPMLGIPVPMATFPVIYFGGLALATGNPFMTGAAALLAVGHIPISYRTYLEAGSKTR